MNRRARIACALACLAAPPLSRAADPSLDALQLSRVDVIGTMPLPGLGTPLRDVPANVQVHTAHDVGRQRQGNLAQFLESNAGSVSVNAAQGNPYQPDIAFRGFTASEKVESW